MPTATAPRCVAVHTDGTVCSAATTTRDCPRNHTYHLAPKEN